MNAISKLSAPRRPRRRPAPSQRDQRIYVEYQVTGRTQTDLAADYKLTQCRVSQIIRRVHRWRADATLNLEPGTLNAAARRRLDQWKEYERLNFACREAIRHFRLEQKTMTHKKGERGDKSFDETTERIAPPNLQYLKIMLQASAQLHRLLNQPPEDEAQGLNEEQLREQAEAWMTRKRDDAERAGIVSGDPNNHIVIRELVKAVVGEPNTGIALHILARDVGKVLVDVGQASRLPRLPVVEEDRVAVDEGLPLVDQVNHSKPQLDDPSPDESEVRTTTDSHPEKANSSTYAPSADSPQTQSAQELEQKAAAEKKAIERKWRNPPPPVGPEYRGPKPPPPFDDPVERRWRHMQRLDQLRDSWRTGLPCSFSFYPEDGPMPPPPPYIVDGAPPPRG
jgi:hypothetical protein